LRVVTSRAHRPATPGKHLQLLRSITSSRKAAAAGPSREWRPGFAGTGLRASVKTSTPPRPGSKTCPSQLVEPGTGQRIDGQSRRKKRHTVHPAPPTEKPALAPAGPPATSSATVRSCRNPRPACKTACGRISPPSRRGRRQAPRHRPDHLRPAGPPPTATGPMHRPHQHRRPGGVYHRCAPPPPHASNDPAATRRCPGRVHQRGIGRMKWTGTIQRGCSPTVEKVNTANAQQQLPGSRDPNHDQPGPSKGPGRPTTAPPHHLAQHPYSTPVSHPRGCGPAREKACRE